MALRECLGGIPVGQIWDILGEDNRAVDIGHVRVAVLWGDECS